MHLIPYNRVMDLYCANLSTAEAHKSVVTLQSEDKNRLTSNTKPISMELVIMPVVRVMISDRHGCVKKP